MKSQRHSKETESLIRNAVH